MYVLDYCATYTKSMHLVIDMPTNASKFPYQNWCDTIRQQIFKRIKFLGSLKILANF